MVGYKTLSETEVRETASAYFFARQNKTQHQEQPTIALVGGQPGAGKSAMAVAVRRELIARGGFIHVDADRMRERIRTGTSKPTSQQTQADAGRLVTALREMALENKRNIVEEGTFRNPNSAVDFIQGLQSKGYRVELYAVATAREESLLGIYQRHELQHAAGSTNPRFVADSYHDEALLGFDTTVVRVADLLDRVRVVNRSGELLFDSSAEKNQHTKAIDALANGRTLSDTKLIELGKAWSAVEMVAITRHAQPTYLDAVSSHAKRIEEFQKERIHDHAMHQLDANLAVLTKDERYVRHTKGELAKAAYFRGFHEKASEFKGCSPNFAKYDETTASRSALRQLPDVVDLESRVMSRPHRHRDEQSL